MDNDVVFKENKWTSLVLFRKPNIIELYEHKIIINKFDVEPFDIHTVILQKNTLPWSLFDLHKLTISYFKNAEIQKTTYIANTILSQQIVGGITSHIQSYLSSAIEKIGSILADLQNNINLTFKEKTYIRHSKAKDVADHYKPIYENTYSQIKHLQKNKFLSDNQKNHLRGLTDALNSISHYINDVENTRNTYNQQYMDFFRIEDEKYFNTVESSKLTDEQINAALTFEDATLVGAAAGSGKSSCIVGKIGFALKNELYRDEEIIALAYNRDAAESLGERLQSKLSKALNRKINVRSMTFHGFGLATLVEHMGENYRVKVLKEEGKEEGRCIKNAIEKLMRENIEFQTAIADWICYSSYESPQPVGISDDIEECQKLYEQCCFDRLQIRKDFTKKSYLPTIPTFDENIYVRSLEERSIANWLLLRGVKFSYEKPNYEGGKRLHLGRGTTGGRKPYSPDFTYSLSFNTSNETPSTLTIIHEHFGLNAEGHAPHWMGGKKYEEQAHSKRKMFERWIKETSYSPDKIAFFETRSSQVRDGSIWEILENQLNSYGVHVNEPSEDIRMRAINSFRESREVEKTIVDFVLKFKDSGFTKEEMFDRAAQSSSPFRATQFLKIAFTVLDAYQRELGERIDFSDMLRKAIDILKANPGKAHPTLVLVDEFQDISHLKASLVKALLDTRPKDSVAFFVGDDWQTINRFSGSDVSIFTGAADYFNRHTSFLDLTRTFRCKKGISDVSRELVLQNKNQSIKKVEASDSLIANAIRIVFHGPEAIDRQQALNNELIAIIENAKTFLIDVIKDRKPTAFILTRTTNEFTIPEGLSKEYLKDIIAKYSNDLDIRCMSMHGSKGLEADFVLMVGLESGVRGFPDERATEPLFDLILPKLTDSIEEERRLFYVGLTRARHQAVILSNGERPSLFIFELEKIKHNFSSIEWISNDIERSPCPQCHIGSIIHYKSSKVCSRSNACGYRPKRPKKHAKV